MKIQHNLLEQGNDLSLQFIKRGGLLPVAVQELTTGELLMMASLNQEAFDHTFKTGLATFWSTSKKRIVVQRKDLWGFAFGKKILVDCDQDALVFQVELLGDGVCHTVSSLGHHRKACFYRSYEPKLGKLLFLNGME